MPSKIHALAGCLLIIGTAAAHNKTHTTHKGDHRANAYTVKKGDNDWTIAHRLGLTVPQLHKLNPNADWSDLQIGTNLFASAASAPSSRSIRSKYAEVSVDNATIRRSPDVDGDKITLVDKGTKATVIKSSNGWYELRFPKGTIGWVRADLLNAAAEPAEARVQSKKSPKRVAAAKAQPAIFSRTSRWEATRLTKKHEEEKTPVKVAMLETAAAVNAGPTDEEVLSKAFDMRGTHYVWGGLSARGVDCSGFTSIVFRRVGINLPRTSRSQSQIGVHVGFSELQPGDLLFFHTGGSHRVNHVGLYVGNGKFIHASSGYGAVRVDTLSGHYGHELVTARRVPQLRHVDVAAATEVDEKTIPSTPTVPQAAGAKPSEVAAKPEETAAKQDEVASREPKTAPAPPKHLPAEEKDQDWQLAGSLTAREKAAAQKAKADGDHKAKGPDLH